MNTADTIKQSVKDKYTEIARQDAGLNRSSCCGVGGCSTEVYNIMTDDYTGMQGYVPSADLGLGCGIPTEFADMKPGDTVLDLGSGAGNDCFVARSVVGEKGKVIGLDMTEAMIELARENAEKLGFNNVEFRLGDIEKMPIGGNRVDVVLSNCVLNLVPDKQKAFSEIYRVLKPGGHFSISDVVLEGELPDALKNDAEMYAGCVAGAIRKEEYLGMLRSTGFKPLIVQKQKAIVLPDDILNRYLDAKGIEEFRSGQTGIFSITVFGLKPAQGCDPASGCC